MIRYGYNSQVDPPAPFVLVSLRNTADGAEIRDLPAQIDTSADRTVLPEKYVQSLGLAQIGNIQVAGFAGATYSLSTFVVQIGLHNLNPLTVKVIGADEPWVLLGRDVVNALRLGLDGPQFLLDIG
jgi:predicted aspartyl protease